MVITGGFDYQFDQRPRRSSFDASSPRSEEEMIFSTFLRSDFHSRYEKLDRLLILRILGLHVLCVLHIIT